MDEGKNYCCLVECFVKPGSFTQHSSTVFGRNFNIKGDIDKPEYRVKQTNSQIKEKDFIIYRT